MRQIIKSALAIEELAYTLDNVSNGDRVSLESFTDQEILGEAKYVLSLFLDPHETHWNREDYIGENGLERQKWARGQVRKMQTFINKYEKI